MPRTAPLPQGVNSSDSNWPHLRLSPHGRIYFHPSFEASETNSSRKTAASPQSKLAQAFKNSSANGLLSLAKTDLPADWPAEFVFWKEFVRQLGTSLCGLDETGRAKFTGKLTLTTLRKLIPPPDALQLSVIISDAPPMDGLEYLDLGVLTNLWLDADSYPGQILIGESSSRTGRFEMHNQGVS